MSYPEPFNLPIITYTHGPGYEDCTLDITDSFDGTFKELLINRAQNYEPDKDYCKVRFCKPLTNNFKPISDQIVPSLINEDLHYRKTMNGAILLDSDEDIVGFYVDHVVTVSEEFRGLRLGMELIIIASLFHKVNPGWDNDLTMYTQDGLIAHRRAWEYVRRFPDMYVV